MTDPQSFVVGQPVTVEWQLFDALEIAQGQYSHVEIELDTTHQAVIAIGVPAYQLPQALLTVGMHAARGRVCNSSACGEWDEIVFHVTPIAPGLLREFKLTGKSIPVTPAEGAEMAHSYSYLAQGTRLTEEKLIKLANKYGNRPQTRGGVLAFLDEELVKELTA